MKKMSISPMTHVDMNPEIEEELEIKEEEETDKQIENQSSAIPKLVLTITIPYILILPLFSKNLHDWYTSALVFLFICFTLDLVFIAIKFYGMLRPLSSLEATSLTAMLLFFFKYICGKYESPLSIAFFLMFMLLLTPAYYRCWLLLKFKTSHKKMFRKMVEDDF